jgi:hypothetical protein
MALKRLATSPSVFCSNHSPSCDRPWPPPTAVPSKESCESQKCAPSCESALSTPETTPQSAVQSGAPISSPTSSHLRDRRNREALHKRFPPQHRPNPIRNDSHQIGYLYRITIYRGNQWTLSSAVMQAAPERSYSLRVSFRQIPRRQFANETSSAVVAMEFVAPPVWFWLSRMNVELRRVGLRYI